MTPNERREAGLPFRYGDPGIWQEQRARLDAVARYNATLPSQQAQRTQMLAGMMAGVGEGCILETPVHANWGLSRVRFGDRVYCNAMVSFVDDGEITIGDDCMIGPGAVLATAGHPVDPRLRQMKYACCRPIRVGCNVWIGAGAVVLPGVTIGDDSVIGAGSVVTRDVPAGVVAAGNPCRVLRAISERDRIRMYEGCELDMEEPY